MGGPGIGYFMPWPADPPSSVNNAGPDYSSPTAMTLGWGYCLDQTRAGDGRNTRSTFLVPQTYAVEARVEGIGANGVFECEFVNNDIETNTGPMTITSTNWTNVSAVVWLTNGIYTMTLHCLTNGTGGPYVGRFNYISVYPWWQAGFASSYTNAITSAQLSTNDDFNDATNNAAIIQQAVNSLPPTGGTVSLPPPIMSAPYFPTRPTPPRSTPLF